MYKYFKINKLCTIDVYLDILLVDLKYYEMLLS